MGIAPRRSIESDTVLCGLEVLRCLILDRSAFSQTLSHELPFREAEPPLTRPNTALV